MTLKKRVKFFLQGKPYIKIITLILSAAAFSACSLASMGVTNNVADMVTRGLLNYDDLPCVTIEYLHNKNSFGDARKLFQEAISVFEEETGASYLYYYRGKTNYCNFDMDVHVKNSAGYYDTISEVEDYCDELEIYDSHGGEYVAGDKETMESLGFEIIEGRYPEGVEEVAISEAYFELIKKFGYRDCYDDYVYNEKRNEYEYVLQDERTYEEIKDYSDIIGKTFVMAGDPETGYHFSDGGAIYKATVVGVINTDSMKYLGDNAEINYTVPNNKIYLSAEWREKFFCRDGVWDDNECMAMYTQRPTTYDEAYKFVSATLKCRQIVFAADEVNNDPDEIPCPAWVGVSLLNNEEKEYVQVFAIFGGALGVVSIALQFLTANYSFLSRRKQIGILQSLGAKRRDIYFIFLSEAAALSFAIFVIALPLSLGVYWTWLYPILYHAKFEVVLLDYSIWNVLILAGISFAIPVIATYITARLFLRFAPIENIRKTDKRQLKRTYRIEAKRRRYLKKLQELNDKYERN